MVAMVKKEKIRFNEIVERKSLIFGLAVGFKGMTKASLKEALVR